jgi:Outer membrane protein beta-barrel domain
MKKGLLSALLILFFSCLRGLAQDAPRYNFTIGGGPGFPQGDIGNIVGTGGHFVVGGGANLGHTLGFDAEFMWHDLPPKQSVIALTGAPDGSARLYSVTGNIMAHTSEARKFGGYGIGGIGWYHRSWELTTPTLSLGTVCLPSYVFWGVVCTNGLVSSNAVLRSGSANAFGWNIGAGATFRLGESHGKFYTELRYHAAYFSHITTQVLPLTFGFRW